MCNENIRGIEHSYSIVNDAIHGVMSFPEKDKDLLKTLISSENFQRLRHIKQLGMAELIFPTAVHNRFSHCLGTAYIACRISDKLGLEGTDKKYAMIGALLHDIGHGPFSHAFENFLVNTMGQKVKHEMWTQSFLKDFEIPLAEAGLDYNQISRLVEKNVSKKGDSENYYLIRDIITSQVDADRLDYLLRDSHFCGVPYGNPDIEWIIQHATRIVETKNPPRLGFLEKGWHAVEHFLLCRRIMMQNICYHNKINFFENLFGYFLIEVSKNDRIMNKISNQNLKKFMQSVREYRKSSDTPESFIQKNYSYYKTLTDYDVWTLIRDFSENETSNIFEMAKKIYTRKPHKTFQFDASCEPAVNSILKIWRDKKEIHEWKAFIIKANVKSYESQDDPVLIKEKGDSGRVHLIQKYSYLLNIIGDKSEKKCYLALDDSIPKKELKENLKKYIPSLDQW